MTTIPTFTGSLLDDALLTAATIPGATYQWVEAKKFNGIPVAIPGATSQTFQLTEANEGYHVGVVVTVGGVSTSSAMSNLIIDVPYDAPTVAITGSPIVGGRLQAVITEAGDDEQYLVTWRQSLDNGTTWQTLQSSNMQGFNVAKATPGAIIDVTVLDTLHTEPLAISSSTGPVQAKATALAHAMASMTSSPAVIHSEAHTPSILPVLAVVR